MTSWPDRLRSRGGSPPRAENEAAFCTGRPAGEAGQLCDRLRFFGGGDGITPASLSGPRCPTWGEGRVGERALALFHEAQARALPHLSPPALPAEVALDRILELLGEIERLCRPLTTLRWRLRRDDEVREQRTEGLRLHRPRMEGEEMIAEQALLLAPDPVSFENIPPARGARHHERHGHRGSMVGVAGEGSCGWRRS